MRLTSLENARVKEVVRLRRRAAREDTGRFLVEGAREVERALAAGLQLLELFVEEGAAGLDKGSWRRQAEAASASVLDVTPSVFAKMAMREDSDGVLAVFAIPRADLASWTLPDDPLVVAAIDIEKPGNLGALARSADAFGADGFVVAGGTDLWNPNVVRASVGSLFALRLAAATQEEVASALRARGIRLIAATPAGETTVADADLRGAVALLFGSEERGLAPEILKAADLRVAIPMRAAAADSLNVSVTAGILLYEADRQRRSPPRR